PPGGHSCQECQRYPRRVASRSFISGRSEVAITVILYRPDPQPACSRRTAGGISLWFIDTFRISDLLDVAIIAYFLYQAYALLVNSRAWNVVRGLMLLLLL